MTLARRFTKKEVDDFLEEETKKLTSGKSQAYQNMRAKAMRDKNRKEKHKKKVQGLIEDEKFANDFINSAQEVQQQVLDEARDINRDYVILEEDEDEVPVQIISKEKADKKNPNPELLYKNKPSPNAKAKDKPKNRLYDSSKDKQKLRNDKVGLFRFGLETFLSKLTKGHYDIQTAPFEITYDQIMSKMHKKKVFQIICYPEEIKYGLLSEIRQRILNGVPNEFKRTSDVFILHHPVMCSIDIYSNTAKETLRTFQTKLHKCKEEELKLQKLIQDPKAQQERIRPVTDADIESAKKETIKRERKVMSFLKAKDHLANKGTFLSDYCFIELVSSDKLTLESMQESLEGLLSTNKIIFKQITMNLSQYLKEFGIGSLQGHIPKKGLDVVPMDTTSDVVTSDSNYVSGLIRTRIPEIPLGINDDNQNIVAYSYTEVADPLNILVYAQTQSGKSAMLQHLMTFHGLYDKYYTIYNDMKGTDSALIAEIIPDTLVISFGSRNSKILNTLYIPTMDLGFDSLRDVYELCFRTTVTSLMGLIASKEDEINYYENICNDIVTKAFLDYDVQGDREMSYQNSHKIPYRKALWAAIKYVTKENMQMQKYHNPDHLNRVYLALEPYFSTFGSKSARMKHEYNIEQMLHCHNIVFNYDSILSCNTPEETAMLTSQKNYFSTLYTYNNCKNGCHTIEIEEEFNVQVMNPALTKHIAQNFLMQGSHNKINYLISNSTNFLLSNKKADGTIDTNLAAITDSITGIIIGTNNNPEPIIEFKHLEKFRDKIEKASSREEPYRYSFFMYLPAESPIRALVHLPFKKSFFKSYIKGKDIDLRGEDEYLNS